MAESMQNFLDNKKKVKHSLELIKAAKSKALEKKKRAKSFTDALGREQEWPMGKPYLVERGHK